MLKRCPCLFLSSCLGYCLVWILCTSCNNERMPVYFAFFVRSFVIFSLVFFLSSASFCVFIWFFFLFVLGCDGAPPVYCLWTFFFHAILKSSVLFFSTTITFIETLRSIIIVSSGIIFNHLWNLCNMNINTNQSHATEFFYSYLYKVRCTWTQHEYPWIIHNLSILFCHSV